MRARARREIRLQSRRRKCLFLYHYQIHPVFGFMHARIQTWFPFAIRICLNGRSWPAWSMDAAGLRHVQCDNCFTWLEDPVRAQQLMDAQLQAAWPELLTAIARDLNPLHDAMFRDWPIEYYWSTYQSEWATDLLFRDRAALAALYPRLVQPGMTTFGSPDVLRFLGGKVMPDGAVPPRLTAAVTSDLKHRPEGVRIKHRSGENTIKMYDKQGRVLRGETTINDVAAFKTFRAPAPRPEAEPSWQRMRKGIADLHRRSEAAQAANQGYLRALAAVDEQTPPGRLAGELCRSVTWPGRRVRALNPYAADDGKLLATISRGEFAIAGFRNHDLRQQLFADADAPEDVRRRHAAAVSRKPTLPRAHGLIQKVQGTHRYQLTNQGRVTLTALMTARNVGTAALTKLAASINLRRLRGF